MSNAPRGPGWWQASDGRWYTPERHPDFVPTTSRSPDPAVRETPSQPALASPPPLPESQVRAATPFVPPLPESPVHAAPPWVPPERESAGGGRDWKKIGLVGAGVVALLAIVGVLSRSSGEDDTVVAGTSVNPPTTASAPTSSDPPTTTESPTTTDPLSAQPTAPFTGFSAPVTLDGVGDDARDMPAIGDVAIMEISHTGEGTFVVQSSNGLHVNHAGPYSGVVFAGDAATAGRLEITADGAWSITVRPVLTLGVSEGLVEGSGDAVVILPTFETTAIVSHTGSGSFTMRTHGGASDLAVDTSGPYAGTVVFLGEIIEIRTDGAWTINPT